MSTLRVEIATPSGDGEVVSARLHALGALGTWDQSDRIVGWFDDQPDLDPDLTDRAEWSDEPDRDWAEGWKATIGEVRAGRFVIVPSWLVDGHVAQPDEVALVLDPGRAFGTGHHATTALCLELLDEHLGDDQLRDGRVTNDAQASTDASMDASTRLADVGCGSGILAIAAARRGARAVAVDIDPAAVEVTRDNAAANAVVVDVRRGGPEALVDDGPFDVVVANLLTDTVATLATELVALTSGVLIVSGITASRRDVALGPLTAAGCTVEDVRVRDGWIAARLVPSPT
ncbi:MAG: 50S ribosomal protein L11 methyltransferase, partial [Nitriliruptoraceae bacterium]